VECAINRPLATLQQALRLIAEAGRGNAVFCLDPLNFIRAGDRAEQLKGLDARLLPFAQISDGVLGPGEPDPSRLGRLPPNQRRMPGEGTLPLREILDALPAGLPLSVEVPLPKTAQLSAREWAKSVAESTRRFLDGYDRARN
jgi:sugar phosphate isomerase/epimerase